MMPRDMELIRELLLRFEKDDVSFPAGRTRQEVAYHVKQMKDSGLVDALIHEGGRGRKVPDAFVVNDITPLGHDLIQAIRTEGFWNRLLDHAKKQAMPMTLDLLIACAKELWRKVPGVGD